jgi:hypothetical protein
LLSSSPASLTGNQLVSRLTILSLPDKHWLQHAVTTNAVSQLIDGCLIKIPARLRRTALNHFQSDIVSAWRRSR